MFVYEALVSIMLTLINLYFVIYLFISIFIVWFTALFQ
jgi:hypothetical protein